MYKKAQAHFKKADPILYKASLDHDIADIVASEELFRDIVWTIIGQQLSGKAADTIFGRFEALFPGKILDPGKILAIHDVKMRGAGLSGAKTRAIKSLSQAVADGSLDLGTLAARSDDEVKAELTKVKGIGPWTAEMILMFSLGRMDIFSAGDLGLQKGLVQLYKLRTFPNEKKLKKITDTWSPYRTYAARVLWRVADAARLAKTGEARIARKRKTT